MNDLPKTLQNASLPDLQLFNITGREPQVILIGSDEIPYTEYISRNRSSELWIRDNIGDSIKWTGYSQAHLGDRIELIACSPKAGRADLYMIPYGNGAISHRGYDLFPGYFNMTIEADRVGRSFFILFLDSRPSAAVVDVLPLESKPDGKPVDVKTSLPRRAKITIVSERVKGYYVYVDGVFYSSDIADGTMDGIASFYLNGDRTYTITVSKRDITGTTYTSDHRRSFKGGYDYTLRI